MGKQVYRLPNISVNLAIDVVLVEVSAACKPKVGQAALGYSVGFAVTAWARA